MSMQEAEQDTREHTGQNQFRITAGQGVSGYRDKKYPIPYPQSRSSINLL